MRWSAPRERVRELFGLGVHVVVGDADDDAGSVGLVGLPQEQNELLRDEAALVLVESPARQCDVRQRSDSYVVTDREFVREPGDVHASGLSEWHEPDAG